MELENLKLIVLLYNMDGTKESVEKFTVNEEKTSDYVQEIHNVFRLLDLGGVYWYW
jgi:hypothetical protein